MAEIQRACFMMIFRVFSPVFFSNTCSIMFVWMRKCCTYFNRLYSAKRPSYREPDFKHIGL